MAIAQRCNGQFENIHIFAGGKYGNAVASVVKELASHVVITQVEEMEQIPIETMSSTQLYVLTSWRPMSKLCHILEEISYTHKTPFIPAIMMGPLLQVGPVIIPGMGACYTCYEKRFFQHSPLRSRYKDIYHYYDTHPTSGPQGYLHSFADLAATLIAQLTENLASDAATVAAHIWQWNTINLEGGHSIVTGIHGCPRCGLQRDETRRSYEEMHQHLATLFSWENPKT